MRFKLFKYLFYFFLFLTIYYFVMFVLLSSDDPQFNKFEKYNRLFNWDLEQYAVGDFDNDGQKDVISYTGCAFLSSANIKDIPQNQQCTAIEITAVVYSPDQKYRVGQKYAAMQKSNLEREESNLERESHSVNGPINHSYLFKKQNENWKIFVSSDRLEIFEIRKDGLLQKIDNVPIEFKLDEILYVLSFFALFLILPLAPLFLFIGPGFLLVIFPIITTILYFLWKRINLINFFIRGFYLGNKNLYIFLINLFLSIPLLMNNLALNIVFLLINIGFVLSIPLLLTHNQDKNLNTKQTINIVLNSVKRSTLPVMLLLFLLAIFIMLSLGILSIILNPTEGQRMQLLQIMPKLGPYIYIAIRSLLLFTYFFFSLEQEGLFTSMKKSIVVSFRNLNFIILMILFQTLIYYTTTLMPLEDFWKQLLDIVINSYILLIVIASSLFYYQNVIKKT